MSKSFNLSLWFMIIAWFFPNFFSYFSDYELMWWGAVGWLRGFIGASSFGSFPGGFGWFLLVEDNFRWFHVVCCFSSYTSFKAHRRVNSLLYSWLQVIDWGHSVFSFKIKHQEKDYCFAFWPSSLKVSDYFLYSIVFYVR